MYVENNRKVAVDTNQKMTYKDALMRTDKKDCMKDKSKTMNNRRDCLNNELIVQTVSNNE